MRSTVIDGKKWDRKGTVLECENGYCIRSSGHRVEFSNGHACVWLCLSERWRGEKTDAFRDVVEALAPEWVPERVRALCPFQTKNVVWFKCTAALNVRPCVAVRTVTGVRWVFEEVDILRQRQAAEGLIVNWTPDELQEALVHFWPEYYSMPLDKPNPAIFEFEGWKRGPHGGVYLDGQEWRLDGSQLQIRFPGKWVNMRASTNTAALPVKAYKALYLVSKTEDVPTPATKPDVHWSFKVASDSDADIARCLREAYDAGAREVTVTIGYGTEQTFLHREVWDLVYKAGLTRMPGGWTTSTHSSDWAPMSFAKGWLRQAREWEARQPKAPKINAKSRHRRIRCTVVGTK